MAVTGGVVVNGRTGTILALSIFAAALLFAGCAPENIGPVDFEDPDYVFTLADDGLEIVGMAFFHERECGEGTEDPLIGTWSEGIWTSDYPPSVGSGTDIAFAEDGTVRYLSWNKILIRYDTDDEGEPVGLKYETEVVSEKKGRWRRTGEHKGEIVFAD